jgi:hypothetical protein
MAADPSVKICRIVLGELTIVQGRVEKSDAWSVEGRRARARLKSIFATMRRLARDSGEPILQDGVEKLIHHVRANIPEIDGPHGRN